MEDVSALIKNKLRSFRNIHLVMVLADVVYGVVIVYVSKYAPIEPTLTNMNFITTFESGIIAYTIFMVFTVIKVRKKFLSSDSIFVKKENTKVVSDEPPFIANYLSSLFILWALIETITIAGLILFLTTGELISSLVFIALGAFFKFVNGPQLEELNDLSQKFTSISTQG